MSSCGILPTPSRKLLRSFSLEVLWCIVASHLFSIPFLDVIRSLRLGFVVAVVLRGFVVVVVVVVTLYRTSAFFGVTG